MKVRVILIAVFAVLIYAQTPAVADEQTRSLIDQRCTMCHSSDRIYNSPTKTLEGWRETVLMMMVNGAAIDNQQLEQIALYLYGRQEKP